MWHKLPSGNYVNLDLAYKIDFDIILDSNNTPRQKCKVVWDNHTSNIYSDNDALFIKDYLDTHDGKTFLIHELDYATQMVTLGLALKQLEELTGDNCEEIAKNFIALVSELVKDLTPEQILAIRKSYEDNIGLNLDAVIGFMNL